jgi:uncharacterized low-complexity protein
MRVRIEYEVYNTIPESLMKKINKTPLAAAMGAALISTFAANVQANPFGMTELSSGYMQVAEADTDNKKAGEMACGASMGGMAKPKAAEGACAGNKPAGATKAPEGACGEGKCGAMMQEGKMKKGMESVCGAMMKGKEGACGDKMKAPAPATPKSDK